MGRFHKICHNDRCVKGDDGKRKNYSTDARNQKYCSEECLEVGRKRATGRARRKKDYRKNSEEYRRMSMSRKQAREFCISEHALSGCTRCGAAFSIRDLEDHHRNGDPFCNTVDNLTLVCNKCHSKSDTEWRKCEKTNIPIPDMRQFKQIGVVMQDLVTGQTFVVYPAEDNRHDCPVPNPTTKETNADLQSV